MLKINGRNYCEHCFAEMNPNIGKCPFCSYPKNNEKYPTALSEGSILAGRYVVGRVLGKGGFGVTYLCYDSKDRTRVAIKEYLPDSLTHRNTGETQVSTYGGESEEYFKTGAQKFYDEAKLVSRFNGNPNIISVYEFFYENNTTYFVMEYLDGIDLKHYIKEKGGKISEEEVLYVANKITEALMIVHSTDVLHRDISPDNIFLCNDGKVKLIDFGAARQVVSEASKSLSVILKQGFAPLEQYQKRGHQGPWTDIYALGASLYYALTGEILDDAMSRIADDTLNFDGISPEFAAVLEKMLAVKIEDRYQNTFELKAALSATATVPKAFETKASKVSWAVTEHLPEVQDEVKITNDYPLIKKNEKKIIDVNEITEKIKDPTLRKKILAIGGAVFGVLVLLIVVLSSPDKADSSLPAHEVYYDITTSTEEHEIVNVNSNNRFFNTVSADLCHSVAIKSDGTVVAVGGDIDGDECDVSNWKDIVSVETDSCVTYGLKSDGTIVSAGFYNKKLNDIFYWSDIVGISASLHFVGVKSDGTVVATGDNQYGQCDVSDWENIEKAVADGYVTIGLKSDGTVVATGYNEQGQCNVSGWTDIIDIDTNGYTTVGLKSDGTLAVAGSLFGNINNILGWSDIADISVVYDCVVGLKSDGTVVIAEKQEKVDYDVADWDDIVAVDAGDHCVLGLKSDGTVVATGDNQYGQCNVSEWENIKTPDFLSSLYLENKKSKFDGLG